MPGISTASRDRTTVSFLIDREVVLRDETQAVLDVVPQHATT